VPAPGARRGGRSLRPLRDDHVPRVPVRRVGGRAVELEPASVQDLPVLIVPPELAPAVEGRPRREVPGARPRSVGPECVHGVDAPGPGPRLELREPTSAYGAGQLVQRAAGEDDVDLPLPAIPAEVGGPSSDLHPKPLRSASGFLEPGFGDVEPFDAEPAAREIDHVPTPTHAEVDQARRRTTGRSLPPYHGTAEIPTGGVESRFPELGTGRCHGPGEGAGGLGPYRGDPSRSEERTGKASRYRTGGPLARKDTTRVAPTETAIARDTQAPLFWIHDGDPPPQGADSVHAPFE
jgi:hypothetical protein